jgi:uncharacterized protein YbjT (DUF2867 family)
MRVLVTGGRGFLGRHIVKGLQRAEHDVLIGARHAQQANEIAIDYVQDTDAAIWLPRLAGIDAVVNAVGVLRDTAATPMQALHSSTPQALFKACEMSGIKHVIHISALGVGDELNTAYMRTKQHADDYLQASRLNWTILRPSLVYGADGASASMFRLLAKMPLVVLPGCGDMMVQPVHIDDVVQAVVLRLNATTPAIINCVGPEAMHYKEMIACYAQQLNRNFKVWIPTPWWLMQGVAALAGLIPASPLEPETLVMLKAGNQAESEPFAQLLGYTPRSPHTFLQEVA